MPKLEQIAQVDEKKFGLTEVRVSSVLSLPFLMGLMSIYTYIVYVQVPLSLSVGTLMVIFILSL